MPADFVRLSESLPPALDRRLGYDGGTRFVLFRYVPRLDEVLWQDGQSSGVAPGSWLAFIGHVAPLAGLYEVNLGSSESVGKDALVIDREKRRAYFAPRESAERFLARRPGEVRGPKRESRNKSRA